MTFLLLDILINLSRAAQFFIFLTVIFSWFPSSYRHPLVRFCVELARPFLRLARRITPRIGMFDLSPLVALLALSFLEAMLWRVKMGL